MDVLSPQELGDPVNAIADAVENPDKRALCKRHLMSYNSEIAAVA